MTATRDALIDRVRHRPATHPLAAAATTVLDTVDARFPQVVPS